MIDNTSQYQDLLALYTTYSDEELVELALNMSDLTETAQDVLKGELTRRRIPLPSPDSEHSSEDPANNLAIDRFAALAPDDCIWEFAEDEDALAASEALRAAGIESSVTLPSAETLNMGAPRLAVRPQDIERTEAILSKPIPEEFRILVRTRDEFVAPSCVKCGAVDPLLESIEPTNQWRCEICHHVWLEGEPSLQP